MFFVLNKLKIYSYLILCSTVAVLFFTVAIIKDENNMEVIETSGQIQNEDNVYIRFQTNKNEVAIKINCLNNDNNIDEIIEISKKYNVSLNFCIYGEWVKRFPEKVCKINEAGNSIINMGNNYTNLTKLNNQDMIIELKSGNEKIEKLINKKINLISCPYNEVNYEIKQFANENKFEIISRSIDTLDYQGLEASVIWSNIKNNISPGEIIEMNSNAEHIVEELEMVLNGLKDRNYNLINLEEYYEKNDK